MRVLAVMIDNRWFDEPLINDFNRKNPASNAPPSLTNSHRLEGTDLNDVAFLFFGPAAALNTNLLTDKVFKPHVPRWLQIGEDLT